LALPAAVPICGYVYDTAAAAQQGWAAYTLAHILLVLAKESFSGLAWKSSANKASCMSKKIT